MRCCLVTLSREAFKPSQFSEANVLSQRLFSLEKNFEGKLNLTDIGFILLLGQTIMTTLGRMQKYLQTCTRKNRHQNRHQKQHFTELGFWCWFISPKYSKFHIHFYFWILKYTSDNRSLKILHRSLYYYHIIAVREVSGENPISTLVLDTESK